MKGWNVFVLIALCLATTFADSEPFSFGVIGDVPYARTEVTQLWEMIEEMNREPLAFTVHVGDIKDGHTPCTDDDLWARKHDFEASRHPFIYVPGDNEWTDCGRAEAGGHDPAIRLNRLREIFFVDGFALGRAKLQLARQSEDTHFVGYRENARWQWDGVVFITLNLPGSNNGWVPKAKNREFFDRLSANSRWLEQGFELARQQSAPALVLFMQGDPGFEERLDRHNSGRRRDGYFEFKEQLITEAARFGRPILVVHGDSHRYRFDRPVTDFARGRAIENVHRLETFGSPLNGWVKVSVDVRADQPFGVEPRSYPPAPRNERQRPR